MAPPFFNPRYTYSLEVVLKIPMVVYAYRVAIMWGTEITRVYHRVGILYN